MMTHPPEELSREALTQSLRQRGFRLTPQREKIIDIFFDLPEGEHLSAEDLYNILQREQMDVSLATSYRTLKLLASVGVLRELDFAEDHKHYELARNPESPHHHMICVDSGRTEEFESPEAYAIAKAVCAEKGFELVDVQLKIFVRCGHCDDHEPHSHGHAQDPRDSQSYISQLQQKSRAEGTNPPARSSQN